MVKQETIEIIAQFVLMGIAIKGIQYCLGKVEQKSPKKSPIQEPQKEEFNQEKVLSELAGSIEKELGKESADEFRSQVEGKTFTDKNDIIKQIDEIVYPKEETFTEEEYDNDQFKKALKAIEDGKSNQAVIIAKDLPIKEKQKVVDLLEEAFKKADKEAKPILKEYLEIFKEKVGKLKK